ncbi:hypothetical protein M011DRAFT_252814 [Sporormia fimetaria CBS 119925]|uniref:Fungal N-terminal domain-containing protein n=1 Tax=Sporormia fimetaria CBS 119925 TaxID=1340428 RepID=A0A6A6UZN8_9PLEO|nr:hypothetical protein M011DRAFT_252814 [Sporormia fimetaria CBS 119925]
MEAVGVSIAVNSLPLQLFQTAETVRTYIRNYKQAPAEATRLADTLKTFGDVLKTVDEFIRNQHSHYANNNLYSGASATLSRILKRCEAHLQPLEMYWPSTRRHRLQRRARGNTTRRSSVSGQKILPIWGDA